ncbi:MAG: hypothetical protein HC882_05360, partial [Acidobacteria bacterium]|nr:hypothetical protein [Acidobacteriota bacterium]
MSRLPSLALVLVALVALFAIPPVFAGADADAKLRAPLVDALTRAQAGELVPISIVLA